MHTHTHTHIHTVLLADKDRLTEDILHTSATSYNREPRYDWLIITRPLRKPLCLKYLDVSLINGHQIDVQMWNVNTDTLNILLC